MSKILDKEYIEEEINEISLPLVALRGIVGFPGVQLNIEIVRPISLKAFTAAATVHDAKVILATQKDISIEDPTEDDFYDVGVIAEIKHVVKNPQGNLSVVFEGLARVKINDIKTTSGFYLAEGVIREEKSPARITKELEALMQEVDLVLLDVKQANPARHEALTARSNAQTLRTAAWLEQHGKPFWLRYVLVPGISDFEEDIRSLGEHFKDYKMLQRVEILPYHTLGIHKYESMGQEYKLKDTKLNTPEQLDRAFSLFNEYFDCAVMN
jgi:Lon protease-like protein